MPEEVVAKAMQLGTFGVWTFQLDILPAARMQEAAAELEELGYGAVWFGEALGREAFTKAGLLLAGTKRIIIATGIANIYGRDPVTMAGVAGILVAANASATKPDACATQVNDTSGKLLPCRVGHASANPDWGSKASRESRPPYCTGK